MGRIALGEESRHIGGMKRLILILPLIAFAGLAFYLLPGLKLDPSAPPSALEGKEIPELVLTKMPGRASFTEKDLTGQVTLVNVFGSWCAPCKVEHPLLVTISQEGKVPIYGINWLDTPERGAAWLDTEGDPYTKVGNDQGGRTVIALGVTGAPETFVIDKQGRIRHRHAGPITKHTWEQTFEPLIASLQLEE